MLGRPAITPCPHPRTTKNSLSRHINHFSPRIEAKPILTRVSVPPLLLTIEILWPLVKLIDTDLYSILGSARRRAVGLLQPSDRTIRELLALLSKVP